MQKFFKSYKVKPYYIKCCSENQVGLDQYKKIE